MPNLEQIKASILASDTLAFTRYFFAHKSKIDFRYEAYNEQIAEELDRVLRGETLRLIINIPPRYGKTEQVARAFVACGLARNPAARFLHLSYSQLLAEENSVAVKDYLRLPQYQHYFPATRIKEDSDTKAKWETTAGGGMYATSTMGQVTGFGAGIVGIKKGVFGGAIIIDDPIKPEDALSDLQRSAVNRRFETTIRSRLNNRHTPIVIIMQRLHADDLCGYLQRTEAGVWKTIVFPALDAKGEPLCAWRQTKSELLALQKQEPFVFATQYMQDPTPMEGLLYRKDGWKEYTELPATARAVRKNYTDTADTGADSLVSIDYVETERGNFILDCYVTDEPMEVTETAVARMLTKDGIDVATIESNNGGRGFARNVEAQLRLMGNNTTRIESFHQSANKDTRIYSNSAAVQNLTYWPQGWRTLFPKAASALDGYMKAGRNAHDDVPDALTGTIERRGQEDIHTYPPTQLEGEGCCVFVADGDTFCYVRGVVSEGRCYVTHAGDSIPSEEELDALADAGGRFIYQGGRESMPTYSLLRDKLGGLFAANASNPLGMVAQWHGVCAKFLYPQGDKRVLAFAASSVDAPAGGGYNPRALCLSILAAAIVRELK